MLVIACPGCRQHLNVKPELAGQRVQCPHCHKVMAVPRLAPQAVGAASNGEVHNLQTLPPSSPDNSADPSGGNEVPPAPQDLRDLCSFLAPPQAADEMGRLGSYRVLKVLGLGGMGIVFQAEDTQLRRPVALKAMLPALAGVPANRERFQREARNAARIEHDNIVTIYKVEEERGVPFVAMQMLQGESLETRLKRVRKIPPAAVLRVGREIATGLSAAHEHGLIHRDIKPANIWLEAGSDRAKILDFGLSRATEGDSHLTQSGAIIGTPAYLAPEQARGEKVDVRSDLFSLGCVLYRMSTGELPFKGRDTLATLSALAVETPKPVVQLNPEVPPALSALIMRLLAKNPAQRPPSARQVIEAIKLIEAKLGLASRPAAQFAAARLPQRPAVPDAALPTSLSAAVAGEPLPETNDALADLMPAPLEEGSLTLLQKKAFKRPLPLIVLVGGAVALLGFCVLGGTVFSWLFFHGKPAASSAGSLAGKPDRWTVLFRADDPSVWDTATQGDRFAIPLKQAPAIIHFVRLRRLDNGETLILPLTRRQLDTAEIPQLPHTYGWNGSTKKDDKGNRHLGIVQGPRLKFPNHDGTIAVVMEGWDGFAGSGFGHKLGRDAEGVCCCWRGFQIPKTAFEIAVTAEPLTPEAEKVLLTDQ
jgi:hypothetical protein